MSNLPLQMSLYFNAYFSPFWFATCIVMLFAKVKTLVAIYNIKCYNFFEGPLFPAVIFCFLFLCFTVDHHAIRKYFVVIFSAACKAGLCLQVPYNCHLCCHGNSGDSQALLRICWKSTGEGAPVLMFLKIHFCPILIKGFIIKCLLEKSM